MREFKTEEFEERFFIEPLGVFKITYEGFDKSEFQSMKPSEFRDLFLGVLEDAFKKEGMGRELIGNKVYRWAVDNDIEQRNADKYKVTLKLNDCCLDRVGGYILNLNNNYLHSPHKEFVIEVTDLDKFFDSIKDRAHQIDTLKVKKQ